jgi:16S rRNA G1207 methylase RsmC
MEMIQEIEALVKKRNLEYIDAVIYYCEKNDLEVETMAEIIKQNSAIKSKIQIEAENLKMVRRTSARLPL